MKKILSVLCLLAIALGMIAVPAVTAEAATDTFYAGYGIANITPKYTIRDVQVSSTKELAEEGNNDSGTIRLKTIDDPIIYSSYGTSDLRMGQNYLPAHSYDADGNYASDRLYFTKVDGARPKYQIVDGDLFTTCIALRYGDNGAPLLLVAVDMSGVTEAVTKNIRTAICQKAKEELNLELDPARIIVSASHTHSSPNAESAGAANVKWAQGTYYPGVAQAALDSLIDMETGEATIETATVCASREDEVGGEYLIYKKDGNNIDTDSSTSYVNFNYNKDIDNYDERLQYMSAVRHYKYQTYACTTCGLSYVRTDNTNEFAYNYEDGFQKKNGDPCPANCGGVVGLVTRYYGDSFWTRAEGLCAPTDLQVNVKQAYQDMHIVKFDRTKSEKKPIVLLNWRAHPHRVGGETSSVMSSDLSGAIRDVLSGLRADDGVYDEVDIRSTEALTGTMDYLVSYYQGAAGNINETSHDRVNTTNGGTENPLNDEKQSYYYNWEKGELVNLVKSDYLSQGAVLADIAHNALNTDKWWTTKAAGPINTVSTTYGSNGTNLNLQVTQMRELLDGHNGRNPMITWETIRSRIEALGGYPLKDGSRAQDPRLAKFGGADGYDTLYNNGQKEYAVYKYIYDTVVVMRELFEARSKKDSNGEPYYIDVQACRRAVIERDPSHVINGVYNANKTYSLLQEHAINGEFTAASVTNYKKTVDVLDEEIDTILIGEKLGIVTAPHELFDYTSQQIENLGVKLNRPELKILNFCYSNGSNGYVPYDEAWQYTSVAADNNPNYYFAASPYEANTCSYERGAAEGIRETAYSMLAMLTGANENEDHCACSNNATVSDGTAYYHNTAHVCDTDSWTAVSGTKETLELTNSDKYQLTGNTTVTNLTLAAPTNKMPAVSAMICLNGHTLTLGDGVVLADGQTLAICGCEESQKGKIVNASGNTDHFFTIKEGELLVFGGALDANKTHRAILFDESAKTPGKLCMFGGTILNGNTTMPHASGNVTMNSGQFWLYGGTITDGQSLIKPAGSNYNYNDPSMAEAIHGAGGNVLMNAGMFRQYGDSVVSNGVADLTGGNIFVNGGQYFMNGGTITGGKAVPTQYGYASNRQIIGGGGNVYLAPSATFTQKGGTISNGTATYAGGNVCANGVFTVNSNKDFFGNDCSGVISGGYAIGTTLTPVVDTLTLPSTYKGAKGGNIYAATTLRVYGGQVTNGRAGIMEDGTENPNGQRLYYCGGNIYATSAARIACEVRDGAAYGRGNNLYYDAEAVCNLEGGKFYDHSALAKAAENVNIHNAKTVKLVGDCVFEGGEHALRILKTEANVYTEENVNNISSTTPDTGVWLDASFDPVTDEFLGAPTFAGNTADIVLDQNSKICIFDSFQRVINNYYYYKGKLSDGETDAQGDNRIKIGILDETNNNIMSVTDTDFVFARKAVTFTEKTDAAAGENPYVYNQSKVHLNEMAHCFTSVSGYQNVRLIYTQATTPKDPVENETQYLVLTSLVAQPVLREPDGSLILGEPRSLQKALIHYAEYPKRVAAINLLCSVDATTLNLDYTGTETLVIDLMGHDLTWPEITMSGGAKLACIDSTTNDYNCYWEGAAGAEVWTKYGTLYTNSADVLEPQHVHSNRRYLRINEEAQNDIPGYSFHRIYMQVTSFGITPARSGITYTAVFLANARVRNILGTNGYGVNAALTYNGQDYSAVDGGTFGTYNRYLPSATTGTKKGTYTSQDLNDYARKTTLIEGILEPNKNWTTDQRANIEIHLTPCVEIDGVKLMVGTEVTRTYKEQIGKANAAWTEGTLGVVQKHALYGMYRKYMDTMQDWDDQFVSNMRNRFFEESSVDKELDNELDGDPWA